MFLDEIRSHLCPDQENHNRYRTLHPRSVQCLYCGRVVDVFNIISNASSPENPFLSANLAHSYAMWTGDIHVPCKYMFKINCGKILPTCIDTKLSVLLKGLEVLKALNYPFFVQGNNTKPPNKDLFQNLMNSYISVMDKVCSNSKKSYTNSSSSSSNNNDGIGMSKSNSAKLEKLVFRSIVTNMKKTFETVDIFDQYFNILVPYVQSRQKEVQDLFPPPPNFILPDDGSNNFVGDALYVEILKSDYIRNIFSKYCITFDVLYVMAFIFICGDDTDLVYNLILDLCARLFNRYFYLNNDVESQNKTNTIICKYLKSNITPSKNLNLYYFIRKFPDQVEECFSEEFIKKFSDLHRLVRTRFENIITTNNNNNNNNKIDKLSNYEYQQTFPYILFEGKDEEYYCFIIALSYYASKKSDPNKSSSSLTSININNAVATPKGVISDCRKIYRFVKNFIFRVREMQQNSADDVYWTRDMFNLFLCTDSQFSIELMTIIEMMLENAEIDD